MSDKSLGAILEAESHTEETRSFIKQVRRAKGRRSSVGQADSRRFLNSTLRCNRQ